MCLSGFLSVEELSLYVYSLDWTFFHSVKGKRPDCAALHFSAECFFLHRSRSSSSVSVLFSRIVRDFLPAFVTAHFFSLFFRCCFSSPVTNNIILPVRRIFLLLVGSTLVCRKSLVLQLQQQQWLKRRQLWHRQIMLGEHNNSTTASSHLEHLSHLIRFLIIHFLIFSLSSFATNYFSQH